MPPLTSGERGQYPRGTVDQCADVTVERESSHEEPMDILSAVLERPNMLKAYDRVMRNKGAPGVDGMTVADLKGYLKDHWSKHRQELMDGTYQPQPVRAVEIPKPGGGVRQLGIPTVLDRLIQQALHQVLSPEFEPGFSESSYGFRPGRNAGQAVRRARDYVEAGHRWVVDIDLEAFFDRVNHDMLMARVARRVKDKRVLKLIRAYLDLKAVFRRGRGRSLGRIIEELNPKLRGWMNYFRHIGVKSVLEELDGWIRRHLRQVLWLQWKRPYTRAMNLMRLGLEEKRAWDSAQNGRGPWWNAGASHLNQALPKKLFDRLGLVPLLDYYHQLKYTT